MRIEAAMNEKKQAPNIEESAALLSHYDTLHDLTEEEAEKLSDLTYLFFASLYPTEAGAALLAAMTRAIFNFGYECGRKSQG